MIHHRIVDILKTFSYDDVNRFRDYLRSPYFNRSKQLLKLYEVIVYFHPDFKSRNFNKEKVHEKLYTDQQYKESTIINLLANLSYLAEDYLRLKNIENNFIKSQDFLFNELLKRKLYKLFEKNALEFNEILKDNKGIGSNQIISKFYFDIDKYNYNVINKTFAGKSTYEKNIELLTSRSMHLIFHFILQMIKLHLSLYLYKFNYNLDIDDTFTVNFSKSINLEEILGYLCKYTEDPDYLRVAHTYKYLYLMFSEFENEKHYHNFKKSFLENSKVFNLNEKQFLSTTLIQYCLFKNRIDGSYSKYDKELFSVYNLIIDNEYYKVEFNDYFPIQLFRNIIQLGIRLKKYKWIEAFLDKNRKKLHPDQKENMYHYCFAKLYFERGMYRQAQNYFDNVELNFNMFKVDLKNIMLKTYYELNLTENAYSLISSYKEFLRTDKTISVERKSTYRSFIIITQKLLDAKTNTGSNKSLLYYIESRLKNKDNIFDRQWLNEKVSELRQEYKAVG